MRLLVDRGSIELMKKLLRITFLTIAMSIYALVITGVAEARIKLTSSPKQATPGTKMTFSARGLRPGLMTSFGIGVPNSEAETVARKRANKRGRVTFRIALNDNAAAGTYVALVSQRNFRSRATSRFVIRDTIEFIPGQGVLSATVSTDTASLIRTFGPATTGSGGYMSWQPANAQMDVYLTNGVARTFGIMGTRSCTSFGFCIGDPASELTAQYGSALTSKEFPDERVWVVVGSYEGVPTYTAFVVSDFNAGTAVSMAWIGYCAEASYCD